MRLSSSRKLIAAPLLALAVVAPSRGDESWSGAYLGIEGIAVAGNDRGREYGPDDLTRLNGWKQDLNLDGHGIGLIAGYQRSIATSWLVGVEFGYRRHDAKDSVYQVQEASGTYCTPPADCTISSRLEDAFSVSGRIGYRFSEDTLLYGLAGLTTAHIERTIQDWAAHGSTRYEVGIWQSGWNAGLGAEQRLGKHLSARIEYRHTDLGSHTFATPAYRGVVERYVYRQEQVALGISYRF